MSAKALLIPAVLSILLMNACRREPEIAKLAVEDGKQFSGFRFVEVWKKEYDWLKFCIPFPERILCLELLDKSYREYRFNLYDSSGELVKEKRFPRRELLSRLPFLFQNHEIRRGPLHSLELPGR